MRSIIYRAVLIFFIVLFAFIYLMPTIGIYDKLPNWLSRYLPDQKIRLGLDLKGGSYLVYEVDTSNLKPDEASDAINRALEIIRNRVDEFGVAEPSIQKEGEDKIVVKLPGIKDPERAKKLIGQTAMLEFRLVAEPELVSETIARYDEAVKKEKGEGVKDEDLLSFWVENLIGDLIVFKDDYERVMKIMRDARQKGLTPPGYSFFPSDLIDDPEDELYKQMGGPIRRIYLLSDKVDVTGGMLKSARTGYDQFNKPCVNFEMKPEGATAFGRVTGANIGRRLSIVLDGIVKSAPRIESRITRNGQITGRFSIDEASDLALVLRTGALPAPVRIVHEQIVGPSLGKDSIRNGIIAAIIGLSIVIVFMIFYYNLSGILADITLILNMMITAGVLVLIRATLTLPGIAGFILSTAMAIDANVLIFERIREELDLGKSVRSAVDAGYRRAFITILDSNLTTLIAGIVLFIFGTGPVKGFATTLIIGICTSLFTAIVGTRIVYDFMIVKFKIKKVYI
ncbi:MAG: protein translocase subunit SecD [bacterium]